MPEPGQTFVTIQSVVSTNLNLYDPFLFGFPFIVKVITSSGLRSINPSQSFSVASFTISSVNMEISRFPNILVNSNLSVNGNSVTSSPFQKITSKTLYSNL